MLKTEVLSSRKTEEVLRKADSVLPGTVMKVHHIEATVNKPREKR